MVTGSAKNAYKVIQMKNWRKKNGQLPLQKCIARKAGTQTLSCSLDRTDHIPKLLNSGKPPAEPEVYQRKPYYITDIRQRFQQI